MPDWDDYDGIEVPNATTGVAGGKLKDDLIELSRRTTGDEGSVVFFGSDGHPTQNNSTFFWDDANTWLGIGAAPTYANVEVYAVTPKIALKQDNQGRLLTITGPTNANASIFVSNTGAGLEISTEQTGAIILKTNSTTRATVDGSTGALGLNSDLLVSTVGKGLYIKEGSNATMGVATLSSGTVTVSTTKVTANSRIFLTIQSPSGTVGTVYVSARTAGTSFTITSNSGSDGSTVAWLIVEPAP